MPDRMDEMESRLRSLIRGEKREEQEQAAEEESLSEQAVAFHRPYLFGLTALHEKAPSQGVFYRHGRPVLRLWLKNACDATLSVGQETYIFLEVERNLWELTLPLEPGFYYVTLAVNGVEVLSPFLPVGYGYSRPCNFLELGPVRESCRIERTPHGSVRHEYFYAETTGRQETCLVYTPPGYDGGQERYPVLYLQHGFGENETGWVWQGRIGHMMDNLLARGLAVPMLIVMADGMLRRAGQDEVLENTLFPEFLLRDLMPFAEERFRVLDGREHRALAGLSMGSMQAAATAFAHPELFAWIGLFSGFLRNYIGTEQVDDSHLAGVYADPEGFNRQNRLLFRAMGREDVFFNWFMEEDQLCEDYGLRQVRRVYEGGHDWNVWRQCAEEFLGLLFTPQCQLVKDYGWHREGKGDS
ncbi:MAG: alpha/beta hydrolase-fold protein, partial [Eubacteriales bacterium]|nr:alpha/beta hydrolase-fold protein [Eubacteriales bacterium]